MLRRILIFLVMLFAAPAALASHTCSTCYIDNSPTGCGGSGCSDSNSGATKLLAWVHAPGMTGATGNASSQVPAAGDTYILRGGDTWIASGTSSWWTWPDGGSSGSHVLIGGLDQTWFIGASWTRPILSGGGSFPGSNNAFILEMPSGSNYVEVEQIEWTGLYYNANNNFAGYVRKDSTGFFLHDSYFHGWAHGSTGPDAGVEVECANGADSLTQIYNNVFDGSDTTQDSTQGIGDNTGSCPNVYQNYFAYQVSGMVVNDALSVHDNTFYETGITVFATGVAHNNVFESNTDGVGMMVYNNLFIHMNPASTGGIGLTNAPQLSTTTYFFNNVIADELINANVMSCAGALSNSGGACVFFNNTEECGADAGPPAIVCQQFTGVTGRTSPTGLHLINQHMMTTNSVAAWNSVNGCDGTTACVLTQTTNLLQTLAAANAQGYNLSQTYPFFPTPGGSTIGTGTNESSLCTTISGINAAAGTACLSDTTGGVVYNTTTHSITGLARTPSLRGSTWDIGAYQFSPITQVNVGGFQQVIPRPNVRMTNNLLTCANFSCATNGSAPPSPWVTMGGCAGCMATNAHIHQTGGLSLLAPNAGTSGATLIQQQVTMPGNGLVLRQSGYALTGPLVSGDFTFVTDGPSTDNTHGGVFPQTIFGMTQPQSVSQQNVFAPNSNGFFRFERDNWIFPQVHDNDLWTVGLRVPNGTNGTGSTYLGDLDVSLYGWPVALFPTFPGEPVEGYFFGDQLATVYQCGGTAHGMPAITLGLNCYRAEIEKPANVTSLSSLQLTVLSGTGPGCSGGTPLVTGSGSTPVLNYTVTATVIPLALDGSSWTVESTPTTKHVVCTTLFDSQNSITYTWPDYVLYDVGSAFYSTFNLYPNPDQSLTRMGQLFYIHGVYDDPSGTYNYGSATQAINWNPGSGGQCPGQATATLSWTNCIGGIGDLFAQPISPVWTNPSPPGRSTAIFTPLGPNWISDLRKHHYNTYLGYAWVTQSPVPGNSDSFGGLYDTMGANGITYGLELNAWHGTLYCLGWFDAACDIPAAPSAVTVSSTGGTIAPPSTCTPNCYLWIETAPGGWAALGQTADQAMFGLSSAPTVSSTAVSGSTNSVAVNFASCAGRQDWTLIGGAWATSNLIQPAPDAFQPIHDPNTTGPPECPTTSVTLTGSQTTSSTDTGDSNQVGFFPVMMPANDVASGDVPQLCIASGNPVGCTASSCTGGCGTVAVNITAQCVSPTKLSLPSNQIGVAAGTTITAPACPGTGFTGVYFSIANNAAKLTSPLNWQKFSQIQQPGSPITPGSGTFVVPAFASAVQSQIIPTDLTANGPAGSWMTGLSENQVLATMAGTVCQGLDSTNFPNATKAAGIAYPWDEADPQTKANMQAQLLAPNGWKSYCPGSMTFGAVSAATYAMGRYYMDFAGSDPYDYSIAGGAEVYWEGTPCRTAPRYGGTWNTVTPPAANCSTAVNISLPQITDTTTRALIMESYASRPLIIVDDNFQRVGAEHGHVARELFLSSMRHIFEAWEAGVNTCCNFWWQRNDVGLFVQQYGNTQAEADTQQVDNEIEDLADVRNQDTVDSTFATGLPGMFEPGLHTIVSNVEYFASDGSGNPITMATALNIPAVANNFTDTTQYPYGALALWTKYSNQPSAEAPDQRVGVVWRGGGPNSNSTGGVPVFVRYTSPNLPAGQTKISVRWEGRAISIGNNATCPGVTLASNQWCDGWNPATSTFTLSDFDVHLYDIDQLRHNRGTGSINGTGSIQTQ